MPDELEAIVRRRLSVAMRRGLDAARLEVLESLVRFACEQSEKGVAQPVDPVQFFNNLGAAN